MDGAFSIKDLFTSNLSAIEVVLTLVLALAVGVFVYFIYKKTFAGVMYSRNFNVSLILLTLVTSLVIMLISNNLTMSLGMVGALSIIRFRTAVKDPIDTVFMFWAVGEGIAIGAGFGDIAVISSIVIGVIMVIFTAFKGKMSMPYLLIIHYDNRASQNVKALVKKLPGAKMKSKTVRENGVELTLELRLPQNNDGSFVDKLTEYEGIYDAMLVTYQGDIVA